MGGLEGGSEGACQVISLTYRRQLKCAQSVHGHELDMRGKCGICGLQVHPAGSTIATCSHQWVMVPQCMVCEKCGDTKGYDELPHL